jgi:hypothetical protein
MFVADYSDLSDTYIQEYVSNSLKYNEIDKNIEKIRTYMCSLRYDIRLSNSKEETAYYTLFLDRYKILFRELLLERDKIPRPLRINIPYTPEFFSASPISYSQTPWDNYRYV